MYTVLYVDDEPFLLEITKTYLERDGDLSVDTVESAEEAVSILRSRSYDVIVSDYQMPGMDGIDFLKKIRNSGDDTPFIIFTGRGREEIVIEAINNGADFYIQKGGDPKSQYTELVHKIKKSVSANEAKTALEESENKFRSLVELSPDLILQSDYDGNAVYVSPSTLDILGFRPEELVGKNFKDFMEPGDIRKVEEGLRLLLSGESTRNYEMKIRRKDGSYAEMEVFAIPLGGEKFTGIQIFGRDLSFRRNAEKEIREKEELYRGLAETVPGMIYVVDGEGKVLYVNHSAALNFGKEPEELTGRTIFDLFPPESAESHIKSIKEVIDSGEPFYRDMVEKFPGGEVYISVILSPLKNSDGATKAVLGLSYDITERKRMEEELKKSEEQYAETLDAMTDAVSVVDRDLKFLLVNNSFRKMAGDNGFEIPDDICGCRMTDLLGFLQPGIFEEYNEVFSRGVVVTGEETISLPGKTIYVVTTKIPVFSGEDVVKAVTIIHDITKEREAQYDLKESEEVMDTVFDSAKDAIFIKNSDLVYTHVNSYLCQLFGIKREYFVGKTDREIYADSYSDMIYRTDMAVLEGETSFYDVKYLLNGDNYYFSIAKSPIFGEDGSVVGICGIGRDISDRKRTENALSMANKKLDLLSKITRHDLRNKITAISGYCELIKDETGEGYANELIEKQELSLEEMNRIIEFLKKYEVVESEPAKWIDMQPEITEYISSIESNGIRIDVKLEDLEIFSDIIFIRIFSDLINNSIVHGENVSFIDISWKKAGDTVVIVYEDNGCGIADDLKEKIFIKGFGRGTGLGLYYIREILNVLGMSIKETGKSGTGAVFEINVPLEMCHFRPA